MKQFLLVTIFIYSGALNAASGHGSAAVEHMAHVLNLNEDQRAKVEVIMQKQHDTRKEIRAASGRLNCEEKQMLWDETKAALKEVLTEDQLNQYSTKQEKRLSRCASVEKARG